MKKQDRKLKLKGFHQVSLGTEGAIETTSHIKNKKHQVVRTIMRAWAK